MEKTNINGLSIPKHTSSKVEAVETALHQTIYNFGDLVTEIEQMHLESQRIKNQMNSQKEKCESKCCSGSEELKKVIESKNRLFETIASTLSKLNETQNLSLLAELYKIIFGNSKPFNNNIANKQDISISTKDARKMSVSSDEELNISIQGKGKDESVSEIAGTPTGRHSPIIQSKKLKSSTPNNTNTRDKKKCPENWSTPEKKSYKLTYPTPPRNKGSGRLKQQRLCLVKMTPSNVVDLTTSPQFSGRRSQEECLVNIKQEIIENDDTIFPSPTSGPIFPTVYKSVTEKSPQKFKKPLSLIRGKTDKTKETEMIENIKPDVDATNFTQLEESVDLLKEYNNGLMSPKKCKSEKTSPVQANESMSLLQQINIIEKNSDKQCDSPSKRPLAENMNMNNVPCDNESSMSILRRDVKIIKTEPYDDCTKRSKSEILEPIYKEPTVRKKADKKALPGWSCDECKNFYSEIYKDNPGMLAKMMNECSKHRGKNNPVRPKTPPGFWNPRWDVPEGTEEFNRRNNAI